MSGVLSVGKLRLKYCGGKEELSFRPVPLCFQILSSCPEIKWHFIGHLQKNNVNKLIGKLCLILCAVILWAVVSCCSNNNNLTCINLPVPISGSRAVQQTCPQPCFLPSCPQPVHAGDGGFRETGRQSQQLVAEKRLLSEAEGHGAS